MSILREEMTPETLYRGSKERLPGCLGIEMPELQQGAMARRMEVKSLRGHQRVPVRRKPGQRKF